MTNQPALASMNAIFFLMYSDTRLLTCSCILLFGKLGLTLFGTRDLLSKLLLLYLNRIIWITASWLKIR
jgi:hypothetical protein